MFSQFNALQRCRLHIPISMAGALTPLRVLLSLAVVNGAHGAFAEYMRIAADFAIPLPDAIATEHAGPLMCAGTTCFAPFRKHNIQSGQRVGILGVGGLGHLAIQIAAKWGCEVVALSTSADKAPYAKDLGAHRFVNIMAEAEIKPVFGSVRTHTR